MIPPWPSGHSPAATARAYWTLVQRLAAATAHLQLLQRRVDREAARLLAGRKLLEGRQELADVLLRRHHQEQVLDAPAHVIHAFVVGGLERIGAQVEELRQAQRDERLLPDVQAVAALL